MKTVHTLPPRFSAPLLRPDLLQHKVAKCNRCHTVMYPGPTGSLDNHKRGYCSDGVKQSKDGPLWPQPQGIFERGRIFHPLNFLRMLHEIHDAIVVKGGNGGDSAMEYEAFLRLVNDRMVKTTDGRFLFKLYDLTMPAGSPSELIIVHEGSQYLQMDCL